MEDLERLEELCQSIKEGSLCGLGQTAPNRCCPPSGISATSILPMSVTKMSGWGYISPVPL